jgi:hypothetical protein
VEEINTYTSQRQAADYLTRLMEERFACLIREWR